MEPAILGPFIRGFENIQQEIVQHLVGTAISEKVFHRMKLLRENGGLGLGFLTEIAHASFVASLVGVQHSLQSAQIDLRDTSISIIENLQISINFMKDRIPTLTLDNVWKEVASSGETLQSTFTSKLTAKKLDEYLVIINGAEDKREIVNMHATIDPHAGAWITVIAKTDLLTMTDLEVKVALSYRFHLMQVISPTNVRCNCGYGFLDAYAGHLLNCSKGGGHQATHDALKTSICSFSNYSGFRCRMEVQNELMGDGMRADMTYVRGSLKARTTLTDVTVINPNSGRNKADCCRQTPEMLAKKGWAAQRAADAKNRKYRSVCAANDSEFIPLVFESTGHMHKDLLDLITTITDHAAEIRKIPAHVLRNYYINTLSVTLHRCTAQAMIRRSAQIQGNSILPALQYTMSYDSIMHHDDA